MGGTAAAAAAVGGCGGPGGGLGRRLKLPSFSLMTAVAGTMGDWLCGVVRVRRRRQRNMRMIAEKTVRVGTTTAAARAPSLRSWSRCGIGVGECVCEGATETERLSEAIEGQEVWEEVVRIV